MTPDTNDQNLDKPDRHRSRRKLSSAMAGAVLGAVTLTGSLLLLGQTAGADTAGATASENGSSNDSAEIVEHDAVADGDGSWIDEWADFDACLVDTGVITAEELAAEYELDGEFDEEFNGEFDGEWIEDGWFEGPPFLSVENGEHLTFVEFGEGDGTVTVEKVGDEITISTSGDVAEESIDLADEFALEEELDGEYEAWEAAFEECEHLAPEDGLFLDLDEEFDSDEDYGDYLDEYDE